MFGFDANKAISDLTSWDPVTPFDVGIEVVHTAGEAGQAVTKETGATIRDTTTKATIGGITGASVGVLAPLALAAVVLGAGVAVVVSPEVNKTVRGILPDALKSFIPRVG